MTVKTDSQDGIFDKEMTDTALERMLDEREARKSERRDAQSAFKVADARAKAKIEEFDLDVGEVARVGKYRIEKKRAASRSVTFETSPSDRLTIKLLDA